VKSSGRGLSPLMRAMASNNPVTIPLRAAGIQARSSVVRHGVGAERPPKNPFMPTGTRLEHVLPWYAESRESPGWQAPGRRRWPRNGPCEPRRSHKTNRPMMIEGALSSTSLMKRNDPC